VRSFIEELLEEGIPPAGAAAQRLVWKGVL
jgi:hypothetical protein